MKLFYSPGACSLAVHIVLREAGLPFDLVRVDLKAKRTETGEDYLRINAKGYVPALRLDDGDTLTEAGVILQYLADLRPESGLAPKFGTPERYHLMEWLSFVSSEMHKTLGALFNPKVTPEWRAAIVDRFGMRSDYLAATLKDRQYLTGDKFTIADAYLFVVLGWTNLHKIDMAKWPALTSFMGRVAARPAVKQAMTAEGLIK
jgi:glutathione S-transferase